MMRPVTDGSATATFAAKLATLPAPRSSHDRELCRRPLRESAGNVVYAATIIPSTDSGRQHRHPPRLAMQFDQQVHVQVGHGRGDQRQNADAADSRSPDPAAHQRVFAINFTVRSGEPATGDVAAHTGLRLVLVASLILAFTGYPAFDSGLPAYASVEAHVSARVVALSLAINTALIVLAQLFVLRLVRRAPPALRSSALAVRGLILAVSWAVLGLAALPTAPTGFIASGAAAVWIGLLCAGCLGTVAVGARLRRALTSDQDYVTEAPATQPEPVAGRRRAGRSGTRG